MHPERHVVELNVNCSIIKAALEGIGNQDVIVDAEMVAFSDERNAIDGQCVFFEVRSNAERHTLEFWWIRGLIARTAQGARATIQSKGERNDSQPL